MQPSECTQFSKTRMKQGFSERRPFLCLYFNAYISYVLNKFWKSVNYYLCCILLSLVCCLFGVFVSLENFSLIWRRHYYRWRTAKFDLCSARMAIEQWGFFSVPHLLWQEAYVYNGHLHGPSPWTRDAHTWCRAFGNRSVSTWFYDLILSWCIVDFAETVGGWLPVWRLLDQSHWPQVRRHTDSIANMDVGRPTSSG